MDMHACMDIRAWTHMHWGSSISISIIYIYILYLYYTYLYLYEVPTRFPCCRILRAKYVRTPMHTHMYGSVSIFIMYIKYKYISIIYIYSYILAHIAISTNMNTCSYKDHCDMIRDLLLVYETCGSSILVRNCTRSESKPTKLPT